MTHVSSSSFVPSNLCWVPPSAFCGHNVLFIYLFILCMGVHMWKSGTTSRNGPLSHPACPRDGLCSPASRQALFPAESTCRHPLHQLLCFYDILFFVSWESLGCQLAWPPFRCLCHLPKQFWLDHRLWLRFLL